MNIETTFITLKEKCECKKSSEEEQQTRSPIRCSICHDSGIIVTEMSLIEFKRFLSLLGA